MIDRAERHHTVGVKVSPAIQRKLGATTNALAAGVSAWTRDMNGRTKPRKGEDSRIARDDQDQHPRRGENNAAKRSA